MKAFFTTIIYQPLYNGLIFLIDITPWLGLGGAIILFTIIIKFILFPLSKKAVRTQLKMKELEPMMKEIKERHKDSREEQARATMKLYKEQGINPLSGFFLILIQLPILIALYQIIYAGGLPLVNGDLLYSFIQAPTHINVNFLWLDLTKKDLLIAFIAALAQFLQIWFSMPVPKKSEKPSFQEDLARSMSLQMRFILPVMVFFIAYKFSAAIALYLVVSSLFMIAQELYLRKKYKREG